MPPHPGGSPPILVGQSMPMGMPPVGGVGVGAGGAGDMQMQVCCVRERTNFGLVDEMKMKVTVRVRWRMSAGR